MGDPAGKNKDGFIMVPDRTDDLIVVTGHTIAAVESVSVLFPHKSVAETTVIGPVL